MTPKFVYKFLQENLKSISHKQNISKFACMPCYALTLSLSQWREDI